MHLPSDIHTTKAMIFPLLLSYFCFLALSLSPAPSVAQTADTLSANQTLQDGRTLVSSGQVFELGFFSPTSGNSSSRYLGMWYRNLPVQVVWIANRNKPIVNSTGQLSLSSDGSVSLQAGSVTYWSVSPSVGVVNGPFLKLLDNGNLVLGQASSSGDYLWQSFDNITNTLLPEMKLGWNLRTGLNRYMTSWMSADDPSDGQFIFSMDQPAAPQLVLWKGNQKQYRWGPWDGSRFSGSKELAPNPEFIPMFNSSPEEVYYTYLMVNNSSLSRYVVTYDGFIQYLAWSGGQWITVVTLQRDYCDTYSLCGLYGNCYNSDQNCGCLKGFRKNGSSPVDWSQGCTRIWELDCGNGDGFVKYKNLKLPDYAHLSPNRSVSLTECQAECLKNCSCMAFTQVDVHGNGGDCLLWYGDLIDMKNYPSGGDVLYIRMARAEIDALARARRRRIIVGVSISVSTLCGILMLAFICYYSLQRRKAKRRQECEMFQELKHGGPDEDLELPLLDIAAVTTATDKFSFQNKIGQGGFGEVYKGVLSSGQDVAVKRLSQSSGQGLHEFKNEVILIAKLQHRNLVRLLGCCIHGEERMLIYEYLPNKSLDYHLFDQKRRKLLTWKMRFNIIMGIARGLLYLHEDSRLRIIHRDLKPSNVLLDSEMNPKISDFGIAKIFTGENTGETTRRIVGTYGYMSPEYALKGHFSVKSDVFSFGVLLLEIVSGHKNWGFYHPDHELNLIGHAWKLWTQDKALELLDALIDESFPRKEVVRCIQIGLLCVQQHVEDRPTMSSVVYMLGNETSEVPQPKEPGFSAESFLMSTDSSSSVLTLHTPNELTMTGPNSR